MNLRDASISETLTVADIGIIVLILSIASHHSVPNGHGSRLDRRFVESAVELIGTRAGSVALSASVRGRRIEAVLNAGVVLAKRARIRIRVVVFLRTHVTVTVGGDLSWRGTIGAAEGKSNASCIT